jgi:hypothetical protein
LAELGTDELLEILAGSGRKIEKKHEYGRCFLCFIIAGRVGLW